MSFSNSDFLSTLEARGYIHQCSDKEGLAALLKEGVLTAYIGFDCTAPSLHVGSLVQIMLLRLMQQHGHRPLVLLGGGTTRVGDPSGKDASRTMLSTDDIARNEASIKRPFERFLRFDDTPTGALYLNNDAWLKELRYIEVLRDIGRHFSVNRMLTFDSVRLRLERDQELSFLEFNYMILQAYDFAHLAKTYDCRLQMGGSDQWGNIVNGIDLGRRLGSKPLYGVTSPLLTTASGAKMGKTAQGAVWLNADQLEPYAYWQFWRNTEDADVGRFLKLFTELPLNEIARLEALHGAEINEAKKILAHHATALLHGEEAALMARATAEKTFEAGELAQDLPTVTVAEALLIEGLGVLRAFGADGAKLVASSSEARRQIQGGALRVNDILITDEKQVLTRNDVLPEGVIKLSLGKKKHVLLKVAP
jgi:tyrosyl-tRNA synthetase